MSVFFVASKILWWFITPLHFFIWLQVIGLFCLWRKRIQLGRWLLTISIVAVIAVTLLPIPQALLQSLEQWIPPPTHLPEKIEGILLLGGEQHSMLTQAYGKAHMVEGGATMTAFIVLARRYPDAKLVFSGGSGKLVREATSEADVVKLFLIEQGIDPARLFLEHQSRNTHENIVFAHRLVKPKADQNWVFITSAFHMPRAIAVSQQVGWEMIPYPVAFRMLPNGWQFNPDVAGQFFALGLAVKEWIGLVTYKVTSRV